MGVMFRLHFLLHPPHQRLLSPLEAALPMIILSLLALAKAAECLGRRLVLPRLRLKLRPLCRRVPDARARAFAWGLTAPGSMKRRPSSASVTRHGRRTHQSGGI